MNLAQYPGKTNDSYGFYLADGQKHNDDNRTVFISHLLQNDDVVNILLDLEARTLTYFKNAQILGTAFSQLPHQGTNTKYYPTVGFSQLEQWISLIRIPKYHYSSADHITSLFTFTLEYNLI